MNTLAAVAYCFNKPENSYYSETLDVTMFVDTTASSGDIGFLYAVQKDGYTYPFMLNSGAVKVNDWKVI